MAEPNRHDRLQPSLLDRLTDDAPDQRREASDRQVLSMQQLRSAVLRDLAWLLNTTNLDATDDLDGVPLVAGSTLNYGVPGFTGVVATAERVVSLEQTIANAIRQFEPRIRPGSVRVKARDGGSDGISRLVFEIRGELWAQPVPQQLFLETSVDIATRLAVVTDTRARG
ncbi:MAG TPA: type VI secretion system baseplate subunit TssE [Acetobacteraceae bacterium]|jgi:type VI secretion system protein ImpF|nr:type VI secretion system baseplate subunit TssE [Acetobacteraceae bacterium]